MIDIRVTNTVKTDQTIKLNVSLQPEAIGSLMELAFQAVAAKHGVSCVGEETFEEACERALGEHRTQAFVMDALMDLAAPFARSSCEDVTTVGDPRVDRPMMPLKPDQPFDFAVEYVLLPQLELSSYEPVEIQAPEVKVTDEMIDAQIRSMLVASAEDVPTKLKRPVEDGDTVDLFIRISLDGRSIKDLSFDSYVYAVGEHRIPGEFDGQLVGLVPGQEKEFDFEGVADFDVVGNPIMRMYHARVRINAIMRKKTPKLTDKWVVQSVPGCKSTDQLKDNIRKQINYKLMSENTHKLNYLAVAELAKRVVGEIPDIAYEAVYSEVQSQFMAEATKRGMTPEQFLDSMNMDQQSQSMFMMMQSRDRLAQQIALDAYARHNGITVEEKDLEDYFAFGRAKAHAEAMRKRMEESGQMYLAYENARRLKANFHLVDNAKIHS